MNKIDDIFMNEDEDRLRAGWRVLNIIAFTAMLIMMAQLIVSAILGGFSNEPVERMFSRSVMIALVGTAGLYLGRKKIDKRSFLSLGLTFELSDLKDFGLGLMISAVMVIAFFTAQLGLGLIEITDITLGTENGLSFTNIISIFIGAGLLAAWFDELFYRGIIYQNLEEGFGMIAAVGLSCLLYGLVHILTSDATYVSVLIIIGLSGLSLISYLRTRKLWLSIGLNASWSFFFIALGYRTDENSLHGAIEHSTLEPNWLSGGPLGPEGGLLIAPIILLAMATILLWTEDRQEKADDGKGSQDGDQSTDKDVEAAPTNAP